MFPIQGSGADMKDLAIQEIGKYFPEHEFWFDLHDGLHYEVPVDVPESRLLECRAMLDNINYQQWWGYTPQVPLKWDASVGPRWSDLKEL
jgi:DNA polymerase I-like protein with 3'-5' exonuclease and polymerase domains